MKSAASAAVSKRGEGGIQNGVVILTIAYDLVATSCLERVREMQRAENRFSVCLDGEQYM